MNAERPSTRHLRTFYLLTVTQVLSIIGSIMTHIAVSIRVFSDTGLSTPLLRASFFGALPLMVGGLFAGALADRWNRRRVLIAAAGALIFLSTAFTYAWPRVRSIETDLPDYAAA
jgi:MFS transporter, DHA3 family, macrolide efflux protein